MDAETGTQNTVSI